MGSISHHCLLIASGVDTQTYRHPHRKIFKEIMVVPAICWYASGYQVHIHSFPVTLQSHLTNVDISDMDAASTYQ